MNKINLPNVDLITINTVNPEIGMQVLLKCKEQIDFGNVILFTNKDIKTQDNIKIIKIQELSYADYNNFCLKLKNYSDNDFVLLVQDDGFIINPNLWTDDFLNYDYIGAPWPADTPWSVETSKINRIGNGGFSLRSKKFLEFSNTFDRVLPTLVPRFGYFTHEDLFLCILKYYEAINYGIKYAPLDVAIKFSYENPCSDLGVYNFNIKNHFGFHGKHNGRIK